MSVAIANHRRPVAGLPELPDLRNYDLSRLLRAAAADRPIDGLEAEVSRELERVAGRPPGMMAGRSAARGDSFYVPLAVPLGIERRDLTTSSGVGALMTPTDRTRLVDLLRARSLVTAAGALVVDVMSGSSYSLPKITAGGVAYWVTEGNAPTESNPTIGAVAFDPHSLAAHVDVSRKMAIQADGVRIVIRDLTRSLAAELDRAALNGAGAGAEPEGLIANPDVPSIPLGANGAAMTRAAALAMERSLADAGADVGSLSWIGTPAARESMRAIELGTDTGRFLWSDEGTILEYPARATGNLPSDLTKGTGEDLSSLILGNWEDLVIGTWGGIEILVDRFTFASSGGVRVVAFWDVDIHPRNVESFVKIVDIVTS